MGQVNGNGIGRALAKAIHWEVVVKRNDTFGVVKALDILARFSVILATINVRHHVKVVGNAKLEGGINTVTVGSLLISVCVVGLVVGGVVVDTVVK